jgi:hypothetical protein
LDKGTFTTIDVPGATYTFPTSINDLGQIVGHYAVGVPDIAGGTLHGFLWDYGSLTAIDVPGATATFADTINNGGQIVGHYYVGPVYHGYLLDNGSLTAIDVPGATDTQAIGINDAGQIVGEYKVVGGRGHGFVTVINQPPTITSISPTSGPAGTLVTINGSNFGATQGSSFVSFGTTQASINSWSDTQIIAVAPSGLSGTVPVTVTTTAGTSNGINFNFAVPSITIVKPNGGEDWLADSTQTIQWISSGVSGNVKIELSRNAGSSWEILFASTANDGSEPWTVTGPPSNQARVKISSVSNPSVFDISDANFTIRPRATISPSSGPPDTMFSVMWTGFTPNSTLTSHLQKPDGTEFLTRTFNTDAQGRASGLIQKF